MLVPPVSAGAAQVTFMPNVAPEVASTTPVMVGSPGTEAQMRRLLVSNTHQRFVQQLPWTGPGASNERRLFGDGNVHGLLLATQAGGLGGGGLGLQGGRPENGAFSGAHSAGTLACTQAARQGALPPTHPPTHPASLPPPPPHPITHPNSNSR